MCDLFIYTDMLFISELTSRQSFQDSQISWFPELHDICHQICLSVNGQENKAEDKEDVVSNERGDDPVVLLLIHPSIYRFAYTKPVLAASARVRRSSHQPQDPGKALGDVKYIQKRSSSLLSYT